MRFVKPMVQLRLLPLAFVMLACPACVGAPPIVATPSACSTLIPENWRDGVPGAPLPDGESVGDWVAFGDQQTAQLDKANGRTTDALGIISRCEERDRQAVQKARRRKVLGLF